MTRSGLSIPDTQNEIHYDPLIKIKASGLQADKTSSATPG